MISASVCSRPSSGAFDTLGHAARYGTWRATPPGRVPDLEGLRQDRARELVADVLASPPRGGWLALDPPWSCSAAPDAACKRRCLIITSHLHPSGLDTIMPKTLATVTACWTTPTSSSPRAPASASPKPSQEKQ